MSDLETNAGGRPDINEYDRSGAIAALKAVKAAEAASKAAPAEPERNAASEALKEMQQTASEETAVAAPEEVAEEVATTETPAEEEELTPKQQIKLRVRQEAQRIRAKALEDLKKAEARAKELEAEAARIKQEKEDIDRRAKELENLKRKARETPDEFFSEAGTSLDDIVRQKLEDGKDGARISNLERELTRLVQELKNRDAAAEEREQKAEAARKAAEEENLRKDYLRQKEQAEQTVLKMAVDGADQYPIMNRLTKRSPQSALAQVYTAYNIFKSENGGREPSFEEILASAERILSDDVAEKPAPAKRKISVVSKGGGPAAPPNLSDLDESALRRLAVAELKAIRKAGG